MRVTWELDDIHCGQLVRTGSTTEIWMIGYAPGRGAGQGQYVLVSQDDGMVNYLPGITKSDLVSRLNDQSFWPVEFFDNDFKGVRI